MHIYLYAFNHLQFAATRINHLSLYTETCKHGDCKSTHRQTILSLVIADDLKKINHSEYETVGD